MTNILRRHNLVLGGLLLGACAGRGVEGSGNNIRFDHLEIGQRSNYAVLVGEAHGSLTSSPFEYVDGVLIAEIVAHDDTGFRVREAFAAPAEVDERVRDSLDATAVYEYYLSVQGAMIRVLPAGAALRSRLFPPSYTDELKLGDIAEPVVEIFGWKTTLPSGEDYAEASIIDGEVFGATYPRLNVVIDNVFMQVDGPGTTWLYGATHGVVRSTHYSWWTQRGTGFDLMPD